MNTWLQKIPGEINAFTLKSIAIIGMTLDHIGVVFSDQLSLWAETALYALGGLTFPIMAFLLVEGYRNTSNFNRYAWRLLLFALIATGPFMWAFRLSMLNILFTLLIGLITLYLYDHVKKRVTFWLVFAGLTLVTVVMDWGLMGVPMILLYYIIGDKWKRLIIPILIPFGMELINLLVAYLAPSVSVTEVIPRIAFVAVGCSLTIPLLARYNGQRGRSSKYLFYLFYPGHLLMLALIRGLLLSDWSLF